MQFAARVAEGYNPEFILPPKKEKPAEAAAAAAPRLLCLRDRPRS